MQVNYSLNSNDKLTSLLRQKNIFTWVELTEYVKKLPYGRNSNRTDFSLVIKEGKGSCSSKHALLKEIANLNSIPNIKLILGIYKMNTKNTPKIGDALDNFTIDFIPEAHCYLMIEEKRIDFTSSNSNFKRIEDAILIEQEIEPHQVVKFKVDYHKSYVKDWIAGQNLPFSFDRIWKLREQCIMNLSL